MVFGPLGVVLGRVHSKGVGLKVGEGSRCQWGKGWGSRWLEGAGVSRGRGGAQGGWREQVSVGKGWGSRWVEGAGVSGGRGGAQGGWREQVSVGKGWGSRWVEGAGVSGEGVGLKVGGGSRCQWGRGGAQGGGGRADQSADITPMHNLIDL